MVEKILIADDDLEIIDLLKFTFEQENYLVVAVNDGEEALRRAKEEHPDVVILDVNMPKMTGFEVCEKIRQDGDTCLIPVIMLTSLDKAKDKITGLKLGADDYLAKPFEPFEIVARVEALIRRTKAALAANPLTFLPGNVSIEGEIRKRLEDGEPFSVVYTDIDYFKSFND
ncbi:MAG: response regulator transcription factor, partial [Endomicrobiales bacterium]